MYDMTATTVPYFINAIWPVESDECVVAVTSTGQQMVPRVAFFFQVICIERFPFPKR